MKLILFLIISFGSQHSPYCKFEVREKVPHVMQHMDDWLAGPFEVDINESTDPPAGPYHLFPNLHQNRKYGPFKGVFRKSGTIEHTGYPLIDSVIFVSTEAHWSLSNAPHGLIINNFTYEVSLDWTHGFDSIKMDPRGSGYMGWPASLANDTTDTVTFYYQRYTGNTADSLPWSVTTDGGGVWRIFSAAYHDSSGHLLRFSKAYQPTSVTLTFRTFPDSTKSYNCHWEYNYNDTGSGGLIYLDNPMSPTDNHSYTEAYTYNINEETQLLPAMPFDLYDSVGDYTYHTFGVEILPHELRYLMDSNVVYRIPDRMVPKGNVAYNPVFDRGPFDVRIGEFDIGNLGDDIASFVHDTSFSNWPGFRSVTIGGHTYPAAHHLIDYVRIWDVPADMKISNFPQ